MLKLLEFKQQCYFYTGTGNNDLCSTIKKINFPQQISQIQDLLANEK